MALYKGQQKITPVKVVKKGGDYYVEQVNSDDGTCVLNITDADSVNKWKEQLCQLISNNIEQLEIPDGVELIRSHSFEKCTNLKKIIIPSSVKYFGVSSPNDSSSDDGYCFSECESLLELDLSHLINDSGNYGTRYLCSYNTKLISLKFPPNIKTLGDLCCINCISLQNVQLPDTITSLGVSCFNSCVDLELDSLPQNLSSIGDSCFNNCKRITIKSLPSGVTKFGFLAFSGCFGLTEMTFNGDLQQFSSYAFAGCTRLTKFSFPNNTTVPTLVNVYAIPNGADFTGTIEVPKALLNRWKASTNWSQLTKANWVGI